MFNGRLRLIVLLPFCPSYCIFITASLPTVVIINVIITIMIVGVRKKVKKRALERAFHVVSKVIKVSLRVLYGMVPIGRSCIIAITIVIIAIISSKNFHGNRRNNARGRIVTMRRVSKIR